MHQFERRSRKEERVLIVLGTIIGQVLKPYDLIEDYSKVAE